MNIYDFFNSPDVAAHCQSINHKFNAVEAAVMVSQSRHQSLAEKHAAYKTIIAEYPDMELPKGNNHGYHASFHKALGDLIIYEECILEKFRIVEPNTVYQAAFKEKCDANPKEEYSPARGIYPSYEKALADALEYAKEQYSPENNQDEYGIPPRTLLGISIRKIYTDRIDKWGNNVYVEVDISENGDILSVGHHSEINLPQKNDIDAWLLSIYIDVPIPFKRGNLVEMSGGGGWMGDVYVLLGTCRDYAEPNIKKLYRYDRDDMTATIYYENEGSVFSEVTHFYPDLCYCRREPKGETRILKYISLHLKGELGLCELLEVQKFLMLDRQMQKCKDHHQLKWQLDQISDDLLKS